MASLITSGLVATTVVKSAFDDKCLVLVALNVFGPLLEVMLLEPEHVSVWQLLLSRAMPQSNLHVMLFVHALAALAMCKQIVTSPTCTNLTSVLGRNWQVKSYIVNAVRV